MQNTSGKAGDITYTTHNDDYSYVPSIECGVITILITTGQEWGVKKNYATIALRYDGLDADVAAVTVVAEKSEITSACVGFASRYYSMDLNDVRLAVHALCAAMGW